MTVSDLPAVNATLNGISSIFLLIGYVMIRKGKQTAHRNCMIAAFVTSVVFLISYITYHYKSEVLTRFVDPAWFRPIYLVILLTHTVLAMAVVPLVLMSFSRALKQRWELHRKISRWTWPIWMYVSVTGVLIYLLLYQIFPQTPQPKAEGAIAGAVSQSIR